MPLCIIPPFFFLHRACVRGGVNTLQLYPFFSFIFSSFASELAYACTLEVCIVPTFAVLLFFYIFSSKIDFFEHGTVSCKARSSVKKSILRFFFTFLYPHRALLPFIVSQEIWENRTGCPFTVLFCTVRWEGSDNVLISLRLSCLMLMI